MNQKNLLKCDRLNNSAFAESKPVNNSGTVDPEIRFFSIATHPEWYTIMKQQTGTVIGLICDRHFENNCFDSRKKLINGSLPTKFEYERSKARVKEPENCASCLGHIEMVEKLTMALIELKEQHNVTLQSEMSLRKKVECLEKKNEKLAEDIILKNAEVVTLKSSLKKEIKSNNGLKAIVMVLEERALL